MDDTFFPKYLNVGSRGPAVKLLQIILIFSGYNDIVIPDGEYGTETVEGVKAMQDDLNFEELGYEVDGNFGPQTRAALFERYAFDCSALPANFFEGETFGVGP